MTCTLPENPSDWYVETFHSLPIFWYYFPHIPLPPEQIYEASVVRVIVASHGSKELPFKMFTLFNHQFKWSTKCKITEISYSRSLSDGSKNVTNVTELVSWVVWLKKSVIDKRLLTLVHVLSVLMTFDFQGMIFLEQKWKNVGRIKAFILIETWVKHGGLSS